MLLSALICFKPLRKPGILLFIYVKDDEKGKFDAAEIKCIWSAEAKVASICGHEAAASGDWQF